MAEGDEAEGIVSGLADFEKARQVRETIPMYADRRPSSYPGWGV